jgi:excisionase family DNA binding protein
VWELRVDLGTDPISGKRKQLSRTFHGSARFLGLSLAFAYELVARGELPVVRFGWRIVVHKTALLELLGRVRLLDSSVPYAAISRPEPEREQTGTLGAARLLP